MLAFGIVTPVKAMEALSGGLGVLVLSWG